MDQEIDPTMSQDEAFTTDNNEDEGVFKFEEVEETTPDSQPNVEEEVEETEEVDDSAIHEDKEDDVEEQRVPYSRFKGKLDELSETTSKVQFLEEQLEELRANQEQATPEDVEVPEEWKKLYGDSELSKDAYIVQLQREDKLRADAVEEALSRINEQRDYESQRLVENEDLIENNLSALQENIGKKLTSKQEESVLSIVDEFSPVDEQGKYLSLFPFDKAYEIYSLRQSQKGKATRKARTKVADLTGNASEGEVESSDTSFVPRRWDGWQDEVSS